LEGQLIGQINCHPVDVFRNDLKKTKPSFPPHKHHSIIPICWDFKAILILTSWVIYQNPPATGIDQVITPFFILGDLGFV